MTALVLRDLSGMAEFRAAEALQREVWGDGDLPDPADLMMVIQAEGGLVAGAFAGGRLIGYVFGFPTRDPRVQHSHRLAVRAEARGQGLGFRLKLYQRRWCLEHGISHVRWTFDPLRATNAALNIHRLGAEAGTYLEDYYGEMEGINRGLPSDRLLADWHLDGATATAIAEGGPRPATEGEPMTPALPEDFAALLAEDPKAAADLRLNLRQALQQAFAAGRRVVDFDRQARRYLLRPARG